MAIISALFSALAKKLGDILQAIFGWSITALFGKLPSTKQTVLTAALVASLVWPLLVVGCFLPGVAAWALAFLPLKKWLGEAALRILWIVLAVTVPLLVGAVTRWITPSEKLRGGAVKTILGGYLLTIGYFLAFFVTIVTVPLVKLASMARGWSDTHVYVQPREGTYDAVLRELAAACEAVGQPMKLEPVPTNMALATKVIKKFARGVIEPIVATDPQRLTNPDLQVYLYPADLLLRGKPAIVARVRAAMTRTMIERYAYLAQEPEAQGIEDEIDAMWDLVARHEGPREIGAAAETRLREIAAELDRTDLSFEAWTVLETSLRRLERAVTGGPTVIDGRAAPDTHALADEERQKGHSQSLGTLVRGALDDARTLAQMEVALARNEVKGEVRAIATAGKAFGAAAALVVLALVTFAASMVVALAETQVVALGIAAVLVATTVAAGVVGWKKVPRRPLGATRDRLVHDAEGVREHLVH